MHFAALTAQVPIPDLPPEPADYSIHPVAAVLLTITTIAMVIFSVVVLRYSHFGPRTGMPAPWRMVRWLVGVAVVTLVLGGTIATIGERQAEAAKQEYSELVAAATTQVREDLEDAYGVQWQHYSYIPMQNDDWGSTELQLPDGTTQDCLVVAEDGYYSIRCGGDTPEESEPLELANP